MMKYGVQLTDRVIEAINEELSYTETLQDQGRADIFDHGVEGQLVTLKVYTDKAMAAWVNGPNTSSRDALNELRKVAAIAIRALVLNGCPRRQPVGTILDESTGQQEK